jgi:hypothetical protein
MRTRAHAPVGAGWSKAACMVDRLSMTDVEARVVKSPHRSFFPFSGELRAVKESTPAEQWDHQMCPSAKPGERLNCIKKQHSWTKSRLGERTRASGAQSPRERRFGLGR